MTCLGNSIDLTSVPSKEWREKYIGDGYRSCCYRRTKSGGQIVLFGYDKENNPKTFICPWKCHVAYNVMYKTDVKDIFGKYVAYKYFDTTSDRHKFLSNCGNSVNVIECFPPANEFLHKMFDDIALDENFNKQPLRVHYFDIETEISEAFEYPKTARNRINMMTIYDTKTEKYYTWSLEHCEKNFDDEYDKDGNLINESPIKDVPKDKFVIFEFFDAKAVLSEQTINLATTKDVDLIKSRYNEVETAREMYKNACDTDERRMLQHFVEWFSDNYPDVLCAHNGQAYDFPYLVNRIERVLGNPENVEHYGEELGNGNKRKTLSDPTKKLSPVGNVSLRKNNLDNERANVQAEIVADIDGIFLADTLVLYRDKYKINQPLDGGNGLDNIGEIEVGAHKIHYEGTLKELYENNWNKFYFYNVIDVDLLRRVEEKVKMIPLSRSITSSGLSNYGAIYSSIGYLIGSLSMFSKTQMGTIFTSYKNTKEDSFSFEGAFVFPVTNGLYKGGVACVDFNSLYPSVIQAINLSPECYVGKISRFPIEDKKSEFFTREAPIDLYGTDTTKGMFETEDEIEYKKKYKSKLDVISEDTKIEKFYFLPANESQQKIITRQKLDELLETKCILTRNNTLFLKHSVKQGVVSSWCKHFYALRKKTKKSMQKLELDVYNKKILDDKLVEINTRIDILNATQQAIKIMINSIFGICGCSFSPIANIYVAQSITRSGKYCNLSAAKYIAKVFKKRFNLDNSYTYQNGGDTDSCFFHNKVRINM